MNITIGSDHGAVALKDEVKMVLKEYEDIKVTDVGTFGTESVDYPDIAEKVCADVTSGKADFGIVLCGTTTPTSSRWAAACSASARQARLSARSSRARSRAAAMRAVSTRSWQSSSSKLPAICHPHNRACCKSSRIGGNP